MADIDIVEKSPHHSPSLIEITSRVSGTTVDDSLSSLRSQQATVVETGATYPDGGLRAWLTVLGAFLALFCSFGQLNAFGTFQTWYADHQLQNEMPSTISWIGSLQLLIFFLSGAPVGRLYDAYGPRVIMIPGTLVLAVSVMMTSICNRYYQFILAQGVLFGLGVAMLFYPSLSAVATHFKKYSATALGIAIAGSGLGGVVYPIMLERLLMQVGFGWTVRISGFITLALSGTAVALVSWRPPTEHKSAPLFNTQMFRDAPFLLLTVGSAFVSLGLFIPFFYIVDYSKDHHVAPNTAFYILSIMNGGGIVGRLVPPFLSDKFGRFNILVPSVFLTGLSVLVLWPFSRSLGLIVFFALVYGFFSGAFNALIIPCIRQISKPNEIGLRIGVLYSTIAFPSLCGNPAAGALLKVDHESYIGLMMFSGTTVVAGSLFMLWARFKINSRPFERI